VLAIVSSLKIAAPTSATGANIVHEADAQRQFVRVPLPAHIHLNGHLYAMSDWSVRGATVKLGESAKAHPFKVDESMDAILTFKMDSFMLQIPMQVRIRHIDNGRNQMGILFQDMSNRQLSIMQQLVSSYISGEITTVEDIIHIVERNNFVKQRSIPKPGPVSTAERAQLWFRKLVVFGVALLVIGYLVLSIYERNFIVEASNAYVDAASFTVNTPAGGTALYLDIKQGEQVKEGTQLAAIKSRTGTITTLESPCNCIIHQALVAHGNQVNEGDSILTLVPSGALMYVTAYIPYEKAKELQKGQQAHVALAGTSVRLNGTIDYISSAAAIKNDLYQLRIVSEERIDPSLLGTPAHVTVDTFH
jgi:mannuronan synthase